MKSHTYCILLSKEPEGGFTVIVPLLPGCITYGADMDEAVANAKEAVELYIESLVAHGDTILF
jgi:antitoxin HicB